MSQPILTQEYLRSLFDYNAETGVFTRLRNKTRTDRIGRPAGYVCGKGHLSLTLDGASYLVHRLAWLYVYGKWPEGQIDHINRVKTDNRIANLRDVTQSANQHNSNVRRDNWTGFTGVSWNVKLTRWRARIVAARKSIHLGYYSTPQEASAAYLAAKAVYHPTAPL